MQNLSIELKNIELILGNKEIFTFDHLSAYQNERIGIVGRNGQGKTSLLNLIAGKLEPNKGRVNRQVTFSYFKQMDDREGLLNFENIDAEMMSRFHIPNNQPDTLSGGETTKLRLTQTMSDYQMGLLLDEPTTHMDEQGIHYLIEELEYYYGTMIIVSHDRYFLDQLVTKIWEVEKGKVTEYPGNYSDYVDLKKLQQLESKRESEKIKKEKSRLQEAAEQKRKQATQISKVSEKNKKRNIKPDRLSSTKQKDSVQKAVQKSAKAMESRLEKLEDNHVEGDLRAIDFPTSEELELHNRFPIMGQSLTLTAGEKQLLVDVDFQFPLGKRIAITGANGSGKSTFLQAVLQQAAGITVSKKVRFSTYEQTAYKLLDDATLLDFLMKQTDYPENTVRAILNNLGFSQGEIKKPIQVLSGGEATRIALAVLFIKASNVLILDEPTNFIDIQTIEALESFIQDYPGTVLFTSHDKYFTEKVADQIWEINNQGLILLKSD